MQNSSSLTKARQHMEVFEDWKADHDAAMKCHALEAWIKEGINVLEIIQATDELVRKAAYHGLSEDADRHHADVRELYVEWLAKVRRSLRAISEMERQFGSVEGAGDFRNRVATTDHLVNTWGKPVRALAPAMQGWKVTDEESAQIQSLMSAPPGSPGTSGRAFAGIPDGDPSKLK